MNYLGKERLCNGLLTGMPLKVLLGRASSLTYKFFLMIYETNKQGEKVKNSKTPKRKG